MTKVMGKYIVLRQEFLNVLFQNIQTLCKEADEVFRGAALEIIDTRSLLLMSS